LTAAGRLANAAPGKLTASVTTACCELSWGVIWGVVVEAEAACGDKQIAAATLTSAGAATAGITIRLGLRWRPKGILPEQFALTGKT
jgi:hypothetical protein